MLRILEGTSLPCNPLESLHFPPDLPPAFRADLYGEQDASFGEPWFLRALNRWF
jgi:hypothetical protein